MNFFKKLFTKKDQRYGNGLQFEDERECECCHNVPQKFKKCDNCSNRTVCRECYNGGKVLCGECYKEMREFAEQIGRLHNKEKKYEFKGSNQYLAGTLLADYY